MAMIGCPGCGLPRSDDQVGVVPCPVCAEVSESPRTASPPGIAKPALVDPTAGLPADVSQLEAQAGQDSGRTRVQLITACAFLIGVALGAGGLLAWQKAGLIDVSEPLALNNALVVTSEPTTAKSYDLALAPRPRVRPPGIAPEPKAVIPPIQLGPPVIVDLNEPDSTFTVPRMLDGGFHLVLRGKVRMLRVTDLGGGSVLDASALEAGSIYVGGKIDGGSLLKLSALNGVVAIPASVSGKSRVEINAPGSEVRFSFPTTTSGPGSLIDGGSTVTITGRTVDLRGDVDGMGTKVIVKLTRNGSLKVAAVRGTASVEYRSEDSKAAAPPAAAAIVAPTATFRNIAH